ncbi:MAG: DUF4403 family protein [Dongiaceae bacterium]
MRSGPSAGLLLAALVAVGGAAARADGPPRPVPMAGQPGLPATTSWAYAGVTVPYAVLEAAAGQLLPESFAGEARQPLCGKDGHGGPLGGLLGKAANLLGRLGGHHDGAACEDVAVRYRAVRTGPLTLARSGERLRVAVPLAVTGEVGLDGRLGQSLGLDHKPFAGALVAYADVAVSLGRDWCPAIQASPGFHWTDPVRVEVARGVEVSVERLADARIEKAVKDGVRRLQGQIRCADIRRAAAAAWHRYAVPVSPPGGPPLTVVALPRQAAASPVRFGPSAASFRLGIAADLSAGTAAPPAAAALALPVLQPLAAAAPPSDLLVPVRLGYDALQRRLAAALAGRDWGGDTAVGHIGVTVEQVDLYPAGDRVAVGLAVRLATPDPALSGGGWVYATGRPVLDPSGQTLRLADLALTPILDNRLWTTLSQFLLKPLQDALEQHAALPLDRPLAELQRKLQAGLTDFAARNGVRVALGGLGLRVREVRVGAAALELLLAVHGSLDAVVERIPGLPAGRGG